MSVILGAKTDEYIFIAGDKRNSSSDGAFTDNNCKVFEVNKHLAFAGAGNSAFVMGVFKKLLESEDKDKLTTEDIFEIAKAEYISTKAACFLKKLINKSFVDNSASCCCFIAGLNKGNEAKLLFAYDKDEQGYLTDCEVQTMITPPEGMAADKCFELLEKNYREHTYDFAQRTIKDIAALNSFVSASGETWIYNLANRCGRLESF